MEKRKPVHDLRTAIVTCLLTAENSRRLLELSQPLRRRDVFVARLTHESMSSRQVDMVSLNVFEKLICHVESSRNSDRHAW